MPLTEIILRGQASRARQLYDFLSAAILDGTLKAGERIIEETIAAQASVSRTPVREAIRRLEADGLIEDTGSGIVVVGIHLDQLAEMCAVREVLEGLASQLTAQARSEIDVTTLKLVTTRWKEAVERGAGVAELIGINHAFHETIWRASGNDYLVGELRTLRARIEHAGRSTLDAPGRGQQVTDEHDDLLAAIAARDGERAFALARAHFQHAMALRMAIARYDAYDVA